MKTFQFSHLWADWSVKIMDHVILQGCYEFPTKKSRYGAAVTMQLFSLKY